MWLYYKNDAVETWANLLNACEIQKIDAIDKGALFRHLDEVVPFSKSHALVGRQ